VPIGAARVNAANPAMLMDMDLIFALLLMAVRQNTL